MDAITILVIILIPGAFVATFLILKQIQQIRSDFQNQVHQLQQSFQERFDSNVNTVAGHLGIITNQMNNTTNVVTQVEGKLGQISEAGRQIFDLARQISSLQNILQSPKMRGGLGEYLLQDLLTQCLHSRSFALQHTFGRGSVVDAALFVGDRILCVDSKFPLENFNRLNKVQSDDEKRSARKLFLSDVKRHIKDIAEKYILPDENTFDFALMFIPAENVYYEVIIRDETKLYEFCMEKKVIPVSPNTFYAYLQVILMGFRGFQISEHARYILTQLQQLGNDITRFENDFVKVGGHIRDAQGSFEKSDIRFQKLKKKVASMENPQLEDGLEILAVTETEKL
jgi:DNA recombination protein RmuC